MRNISVPTPATAPTVALRAEIRPASGATTFVYFRRSCCWASVAFADATRAAAVRSAVTYCVICCSLRAPEPCRVRARFASARAAAAFASASCTAALAWATSASTGAASNTASTSPFLTTSPTLTFTSCRRRPFDSLPITASCHAATLPLAARPSGRRACSGFAVVTVSAGRGAAAFLSSAALPETRTPTVPARMAAMDTTRAGRDRRRGRRNGIMDG